MSLISNMYNKHTNFKWFDHVNCTFICSLYLLNDMYFMMAKNYYKEGLILIIYYNYIYNYFTIMFFIANMYQIIWTKRPTRGNVLMT